MILMERDMRHTGKIFCRQGKPGQQKLRYRKRIPPVRNWGGLPFLQQKTEENPILIISMVEDVKGRGGSGYVVGKDKQVLESWLNHRE